MNTSTRAVEVTATETKPQVTTVVIHTRTGGDLTVLAQPTKTPGLYVTPQIGSNHDGTPGFTGFWQVTHGPSGMSLPVDGPHATLDVHTAVRVADALGDTAVNWTQPQEQFAELFKDRELLSTVWTAIKQGMYPPTTSQWDGRGNKPVAPGDYPNSFEQATAHQLASAYTRSALQRYADMWELIKHDQDADQGRRLYHQNLAALLGEYAVVHLLRAFAAVDRDGADAAARDLWEGHQAGDGHGEWLAQWGREYGIPTPQQGDAANAGATLPDPLSYEQVMGMSLAYPDHGTVGSLRQEMGRHAALHNQRFSAICDTIRLRDKGVKPEPGEHNEFLRAHSGAMSGWGLVAVLGWLAKTYPQIAVRAARMVDDIGTNGGNDYCQDIKLDDEPDTDAAETPAEPATTPE